MYSPHPCERGRDRGPTLGAVRLTSKGVFRGRARVSRVGLKGNRPALRVRTFANFRIFIFRKLRRWRQMLTIVRQALYLAFLPNNQIWIKIRETLRWIAVESRWDARFETTCRMHFDALPWENSEDIEPSAFLQFFRQIEFIWELAPKTVEDAVIQCRVLSTFFSKTSCVFCTLFGMVYR